MTSTQQTAPYVLVRYREMPAEQSPELQFRYVSRHDRMRIERCFAQAKEAEGEAFFERVKEGVLIALAGWRNYAIAYDPQRLDEILNDVDYGELWRNLLPHLQASAFFYAACVSTRLSTQASSVSATDKAATVSSAQLPSDPSRSTCQASGDGR